MRYMVRILYTTKFGAYYVGLGTYATASVEAKEDIHRYVMTKREAMDLASDQMRQGGSNIASISVVLVSKYKPYPPMAVVWHKEMEAA